MGAMYGEFHAQNHAIQQTHQLPGRNEEMRVLLIKQSDSKERANSKCISGHAVPVTRAGMPADSTAAGGHLYGC